MFKCTDCKEIYDVKPDYCKCGNDLFEEFTAPEKEKTPIDNAAKNQKSDSKITLTIPPARILAITFFIICMIISVIPWVVKDKETTNKPIKKVEKQTNLQIPDIEKVWNNSSPTPSKNIVKNKPKQAEPESETEIKQTPATNTNTPIIKEPQKTQSKQSPKTSEKPQTKNKPSNVQKPTQTQTKPNPPIKLPPSVINPGKQMAPSTSTSKPLTPKMNQSEFQKYKGDIRNAFAARLNLSGIQGEGECGIEFSVDSSGKLLNRNFTYKSNNTTVNNEVYYMLMRMPAFKEPPQNYNGEKIRFKIYINDGYYEISYM